MTMFGFLVRAYYDGKFIVLTQVKSGILRNKSFYFSQTLFKDIVV